MRQALLGRQSMAVVAALLGLAGPDECCADDGTGRRPRVLVDFSDTAEEGRWRVVNDGVMGGLSRSGMTVSNEDAMAVFEGGLSLANNGGFASVRRAPHDYDLSGYDGITLQVRGDGRNYQFRIQTNDRYDGVSYRAEFETVVGEWIAVTIPFHAFVPTFRGRRVPDAPVLDSARIRQIGFLIGDKREGAFRLEVKRIAAYRTASGIAE